jgi:3-demethoxyubiquinol 3-hydroxylase
VREPLDHERAATHGIAMTATIVARLKPGESLGDRILKVDHAGEHGAVNVYRAQTLLAKWRAPSLVPELLEFIGHEKRHRALIGDRMLARGVRRCRSYHLCGFGGIVLGLVTGLIGATAIAATTEAIESVVLRHMQEQLQVLRDSDSSAHDAIAAIIQDEQSHHDSAVAQTRAGQFWPAIIKPIVRLSTECVIWLGLRL